MKISRTASFGMGAIVALVIGSGTAYAATGGTFVLGRSNTAGRTTTLTNNHGTALSLGSALGTPPLKVNRSIKVPNLNADLLDGMDQSQFALASGTVRAYDVPGTGYDLNNNGFDEVIIAGAKCPAGTHRTGGGAADLTTTGLVVTSAPDPDVADSWVVAVATTDNTTEDPADVTATIICWSPRGTPVGGYRTAPADLSLTPSSALVARLSRKALAR